MKVIITGATGMVGEGVLIECLENKQVIEILSLSRKSCGMTHPKLKECLIPDFMNIEQYAKELSGYDACFYCAGVSSIGMDEEKFTKITYDTTLHVAKTLSQLNPDMVFTFVTGQGTDSTEHGKIMWARVKGKTENALMQLPFKGQYNFRPGFMKHFKEQKNVKTILKVVSWFFPILFPKQSLTLQEVGRAMIQVVNKGYTKNVLEIQDIKKLGKV
ncbi:MAG TPA: NAD-dependent epimerase/dehydratase family protein [Saprospiraceae bacterium]|jgi:uncharacterized protein YbjT (DUF2867 family)|nr:NAD-dependent epimerase/dehydratase family protein [Saprospiraceae bacterium]MBK7700624.1 NAD-dependent epimerase/dehydratase family protein [Saprospiraceae bacterium]MBK8828357.1 NAD-dependent epimerase/dehydratase family protein [Saprospiraceae bacterium]HMT54563.1 NAD-dependent epimerase/dehydratase family protein [Saprospiraceae bacterium]HMT71265.1 NAD-dependent epimerase/dehydratase family protein [Saprospiraceae bacterium]